MATYQFSALADGQAISFNPDSDVLNFDQTSIAGGQLRVTVEGANVRVAVVSGTFAGKDVVLLGVAPAELATTNITFANGSLLLIGDNSSGTAADEAANVLNGGAGGDYMAGLGGNDSLYGGNGKDYLAGAAGNDYLHGGAGIDTMDGGSGNDTYVAGTGDVLIDSAGIDTVRTPVSWNLAAGFENLIVTGSSATSHQGNNAANRMVGNNAANYFNSRAGNDTLIGNGGNDYFDISTGGSSATWSKIVSGGAGIDTMDYDGYARSGLSVDMQNGTADGGAVGGGGVVSFTSIERFIGGGFNDFIWGSDGGEYIDGRGGDDVIRGGAGPDTLVGGAGNDMLNGQNSRTFDTDLDAEQLDGGLGDDWYDVDNEGDTLVDAGGLDTVHAINVSWTLGAGFENLILTNDNDSAEWGIGNELNNVMGAPFSGWYTSYDGRGGNDTIWGSVQEDTVLGGAGNDVLDGWDDFDVVNGGAGDDTIYGGRDMTDTDTLTGGDGRDRFVAEYDNTWGADIITDFVSNIDEIALDNAQFTAIGSTGDFVFGDARFHAAAGATAAHDASDRIIYNTSTGALYYDADGTGSGADAHHFMSLWGAPFLRPSDITVI